MKMKGPLVLAAFSAFASPALAQEGAPGGSVSYTWVEASYGSQYYSRHDFGGARAPETLRIASNVALVPHLYLLASFATAGFPGERINAASAGVGAYAPLFDALHGVLQLTYDEFQIEDSGSSEFEEEGLGIETGVRWLAGRSEIDLTLKHAELEHEQYGGEDRFTSFNLNAIVPITGALGLSFRLERTSVSGDVLGSPSELDVDSYLLGLRYGFDRP